MDLESNFIFDDMCEKIFPYLDNLKEENEINMIGAPKYIMEDYDLNKNNALRVFWAWVEKEKE